MNELDVKTIRELLDYDPATGRFVWLKPIARNIAIGAQAGSCRSDGYVVIKIGGRNYLAHRLAWAWMHGEWPAELIDHRDTNPSNNAILNLRIADHSKNKANRGSNANNSSGFKGVFVDKRKPGRWFAAIKVNGQSRRLGWFSSPEEAHAAYAAAAKFAFGDFARAA